MNFFKLYPKRLFLLAIFFPCFINPAEAQMGIIGGNDEDIQNLPYQVALMYEGDQFCGGTIVGDRWIITASHCVEGSDAEDIDVWAGITALSDTLSGQLISVSSIFMHPGYDGMSLQNDIAILKLDTTFIYNSKVAAIPYARTKDVMQGLTDPGVSATVSGWGATDTLTGDSPDTLQVVDVPILSSAASNGPNFYAGEITPDMITAGDTVNGGIDACWGDSGGPFVVDDSAGTGVILAGVVSWGYGCAAPQFPGVYSRVSYFEDWIDAIISGIPFADFYSPKVTIPSTMVQIVDQSLNDPNNWAWSITGPQNFNSSDQDPQFSFTNPGTYQVQLIASNANGQDTSVKTIEVIEVNNSTCHSTKILDPTDSLEIGDEEDYFAGNNWYEDLAVYNQFVSSGVTRIDTIKTRFAFAKKSSPSEVIWFEIRDNDGPNGAPKTVLYEEEHLVSDIESDIASGKLTSHVVSDEVYVSDTFYVGVYFNYGDGDTVALYYAQTTDNAAWTLFGDGSTFLSFDDEYNWEYSATLHLDYYGCEFSNISATEETKNLELEVYPNPATTILHVDAKDFDGELSYSLLGTEGAEVMSGIICETGLDISNLVSGIYILNVQSDRAAGTWKVVKY